MSDFDYPVEVKVYSAERYDGDWIPENFAEAIDWLREHMESIPEEYRASAKIEIDSVSGYEGDHFGSIEITYLRPPTPEEVATRKREAEQRAAREAGRLRGLLAAQENRLAEIARK